MILKTSFWDLPDKEFLLFQLKKWDFGVEIGIGLKKGRFGETIQIEIVTTLSFHSQNYLFRIILFHSISIQVVYSIFRFNLKVSVIIMQIQVF